METLTLILDDSRASQLATLATANGYPSGATFAAAKVREMIDREWSSYREGLVSKANSGGVLTPAEKVLVMAKLGLA